MAKKDKWLLIGNLASIATISATVAGLNEKVFGPIRGNLCLAIIVSILLIILSFYIPKAKVKWSSVIVTTLLTILFILLFLSTFFVGHPLGNSIHPLPTKKIKTPPSYVVSADPQLGDTLLITFAVEKYKISIHPDTLEVEDKKPTCEDVSFYDRSKKGDRITLLFRDTKKCKNCKVKITTNSKFVFVTLKYYRRSSIQRGSQCLIKNILYFRS